MNIEAWKERKKELGWTHDELAEKSGISRRTIAGIFSGDPRYESPTWNTVQAINRALGLTEEGYRDTMPVEITPLEDELLFEFRQLSEEDKQLVIIFLRKLNK